MRGASRGRRCAEADERFAALEHEYVVYFMSRYPVVATYLGGSQFDPALAGVDGTLRDYAADALQREDARLAASSARASPHIAGGSVGTAAD